MLQRLKAAKKVNGCQLDGSRRTKEMKHPGLSVRDV